MSEFTVNDLKPILASSVGDIDPAEVNVDIDVVDAAFGDLGFDSLALIEVASAIKREFGVPIEDDAISQETTSAELVAQVNALLRNREQATT